MVKAGSLTLLLIDVQAGADPFAKEIYSRFLELGYDATLVDDLARARVYVTQAHFDVCLVLVGALGTSGIERVKLRRIRLQALPSVIVGVKDGMEMVDAALAVGAQEYIPTAMVNLNGLPWMLQCAIAKFRLVSEKTEEVIIEERLSALSNGIDAPSDANEEDPPDVASGSKAEESKAGQKKERSDADDLDDLLTHHQSRNVRLEAILDSSGDGFLVLDKARKVRYANRAAESILQRDRAELLERPFPFALKVGDSVEIQPRQSDRTATAEMKVAETVVDGKTCFLVSLRDTTDRRRVFDNFVSSQKRLAVGQLALGVAHQFQNHLASSPSAQHTTS